MKSYPLLAFMLLCTTCAVYGNQFGHQSHEKFIEQVTQDYESTFLDVLQQYDDHISNNPDDVLAKAEKCYFIDSFTYAESEVLYFDSIDASMELCKQAIEDHPEDHPERLLYDSRNLWGEDATEKYQQILDSGLENWTPGQITRLYQWRANTLRWSGETDSTMHHQAYYETRDPQFILGAAIHESETGNPDMALELLRHYQPKDDDDRLNLARFHINLGHTDQAQDLLNQIELVYGNRIDIIKLKAELDADYSPKTSLLKEIKDAWTGNEQLKELLEYFIESGHHKSADTTYQFLTNDDIWQDPFLYHKYKLYQASGNWNWGIQDIYGLLIWLALVVICFLIPFALIGPVHYRGLYRRVHGQPPTGSLTGWNLKHALYLSFMFFLGSTVLFIMFQHDAFYSIFFGDESVPFSSEPGLNSTIYFIDAAFMILVSLLIFRHGASLFKVNFTGFLKALVITVAVFVTFKFIFAAFMIGIKLSTVSSTFDIVRLTIHDLFEQYGVWITLLSIAFITPLIEEYLFRGVLLNSFTKHISFAWANILQAAAFSAIHESNYIHHFIFGLITGYFVKTQKHLYGAIMFHMINNALAVSVLVS
ncbi:type II CAAX prenyl endopeptidase Rce1 family protein [Marinicella sediminis]|uniref:Type II CAAX prenyl endopeptidase Rce1 family protein n=1 Tax=Marinicella sediminis TaxID=1792834 RepID=A0ABV7JBI1_9GAMM|nr:CPBP family glutamic-type intramembrane protease [Marinicella sediminis]